jgi:hypothetical protein
MKNKRIELTTINCTIGEFLLTPYSKCLCMVNKYDWHDIQMKVNIICKDCVINNSRIDREQNMVHDWSMYRCSYSRNNTKNSNEAEKYIGFSSENIILFFSFDCPQWIKDYMRQLYLT